MKKRNILSATLILGVLAVAGIVFINQVPLGNTETEQSGKQKQLPKVRVITATTSLISDALKLTGSVEPYRIARLASPAEGPVDSICVREADHVDADETLISIGRKQGVDASIISLREELNKELNNLNRIQQLVESEALPGEQLDQASAIYQKVHTLLVKAEETAQDYIIKAPWAGVVSRVNVKEGEFVAPRVVLLEMYDQSSLVIRASIPEIHAVDVAVGMHVDVQLDAYPGDIFQGRIERVYPYLDPRLRTRTVEIALKQTVNLLPGMFARLTLSLKSSEQVVVVPVEALVSTPKGSVVFVFEDGIATARMVESGIEAGNRIEIVSGIQPGDKVIVAGNEKLKDGIEVSLAMDEITGKRKIKGMAGQPALQNNKAGGDGQ